MLDVSTDFDPTIISETSADNPFLVTDSGLETPLLSLPPYIDIVGTKGRDILEGTAAANEMLIGDFGADLLTGGGGEDLFVYDNIRDAGDTITDLEIGLDKIDLTTVLNTFGYSGDNPLGDGYVEIDDYESGSVVLIDSDGNGDLSARPYIFVESILPADLNNSDNFLPQPSTPPPPLNQPPTDITLDPDSVEENVPVNTIVGDFSTEDPDVGDTHTYELVSGMGSTDNSVFTIVNDNQLQINESPDFETKPEYSIRVETTDSGGLSYTEVIPVTVINVIEGGLVSISAELSNDTGISDTDGITQDPTIAGETSSTTTLEASLNGGDFVDITEALNEDESYTISTEEYELLTDSLVDGDYTVDIRASDSTGEESATIDVSFTLDRTPPPISLELAPESDTGEIGDNITTESVVTLLGNTESGLEVELVESGQVAIADENGDFTFTDVALPIVGENPFTTVTEDVAGNEGIEEIILTREEIEPEFGAIAGVKYNDLDGDGTKNDAEPGLAGVTVYLDTNDNGVLDGGEPNQITAEDDPTTTDIDETGQYEFTNLEPDTYIVREVVPEGFEQTFPISTLQDPYIGLNFDGDFTQINPETGEFTLIANLGEVNANPIYNNNGEALQFNNQGDLFGILNNNLLVEINPENGQVTEIGRVPGFGYVEALAFYDGQMYGAAGSGALANQLILIDTETADATLIGSFGSGFNDVDAMSFTPDGTLYAASFSGSVSRLSEVNLDTGAVNPELIVSTPLRVLALDSNSDGQLIGTSSFRRSIPSRLVEVDPSTGDFIEEYELSEFFMNAGLAIPNFSLSLPNNGFYEVEVVAGAVVENIDFGNVEEEVPNSPPEIISTPETVFDTATDTIYTYQIEATDSDGDPLSYSLVSGPEGTEINEEGLLEFTPEGDLEPNYEFTVEVSDGQGGTDAQTFTVEVIEPEFGAIQGIKWDDLNGNGVLDTNQQGRIVVSHDTNTFGSFKAQEQEILFAVNVAEWLVGSNSGKILAIESTPIPGRHDYASEVEQAWVDAGFDLTVTQERNYTLSELQEFDAIFVAQSKPDQRVVDNQLLIDYVDLGGNVYISGGVGGHNAVNESANWSVFLNNFGFDFDTTYNGFDFVDIDSDHPIFAGITRIANGNGHSIFDIEPENPNNLILQTFNDQGVYGVYSIPSEPGLAGVTVYLDTNNNGVLDEGEPTQITAEDDPTTPDIDETGQYEFNDVLAGSYVVREIIPEDFTQTAPSNGFYEVEVVADEVVENIDFGNVEEEIPNSPPEIISTPIIEITSETSAPELIDLSTWSVIQYNFIIDENPDSPDANWVLQPGNTEVEQTVNADASIFLGDFELVNDQIQGNWRVDTSRDDDFMGFVFGYQDTEHFYLFDWKQADQTSVADRDGFEAFAEQGMSLKVVNADSPLTGVDIYSTDGNEGRVETLYHNTIPWSDFTDYQFTLDFTPGEFTITVSDEDETIDEFTIEDDTYTSGKFGFYNFSQSNIIYSGFTQATTSFPEYLYDVEAIDADGDVLTYTLLESPETATIDSATGDIAWNPIEEGSYDFTVEVSDGQGGTDTQTFVVEVLNED